MVPPGFNKPEDDARMMFGLATEMILYQEYAMLRKLQLGEWERPMQNWFRHITLNP